MAVSSNGSVLIMYASRAHVDKILKPNEVVNQYTILNNEQADSAVANEGLKGVEELKAAVRGKDMTAISTRELAMLGSMLYRLGLAEDFAATVFVAGNSDCDRQGRPQNTDVKFNAIALFNQKYQEQREYGESQPNYSQDKELQAFTRGVKSANHILAVLSWFASSPADDLALNVKA